MVTPNSFLADRRRLKDTSSSEQALIHADTSAKVCESFNQREKHFMRINPQNQKFIAPFQRFKGTYISFAYSARYNATKLKLSL